VAQLRFLGANRQVTGSRYCLETASTKVLVDCGLFQERAVLERNWAECPVPAKDLHALLLTHIHIDHCGLLPRLVRQGFHGPIYCTRPTAALAPVMLLDSARIQTEDSAYKQKRHQREKRRGRYPETPLYTEEDAERVLPLLKTVGYDEPFSIGEQIEVTFRDAGHILGSALLQVNVKENGTATRIVFSGDLGQWKKPLVRDPTLLTDADYVVMESTYGDRNHEESGPVDTQLAQIINDTVKRRGNVVIPVFALERAQELMYHISDLAHRKRIPDIPVFVDSPMAADVTEVFLQFADFFDQETYQRIAASSPPLSFPGLRFARTVQESRAINEFRDSCVIMSTSGMCTEGRIKHHLRNNIQRPECTVLFVGYQGDGTLGRRILNREPFVRIHGNDYKVRASVQQITGFSAHADQGDLLRWIGSFQPGPRRVFLTHGEESAALTLAELIRNRHQWEVSVPRYEDTFQLK